VIDFTASLISDRLYLTMEDMAKRDGLTKIYNRIHFNHFYDEMLANIIKNGGTISVLMADIDHFKRVNDTYGHLAGDEAIKALAKLDEAIGKKYGCQAVRFGGEEFLLIMNGKSLDEAYAIAEELHKNIRENVIEFEGKEIRINTSIGVANYPETVQDLQKVLDRADKAMYYGKTHGRGRIVVDGRWDPEDMK
jgi:diguanylate cyclase (GGDEF)-like protein